MDAREGRVRCPKASSVKIWEKEDHGEDKTYIEQSSVKKRVMTRCCVELHPLTAANGRGPARRDLAAGTRAGSCMCHGVMSTSSTKVYSTVVAKCHTRACKGRWM